MRKRIVIDIVLLIGAFIAPPWLVLTFALIGLLSFGNFYEIFAVGFIIDVLYGIKTPFLFIPIFYTAISGCLFIASVFLRKHLRFYL